MTDMQKVFEHPKVTVYAGDCREVTQAQVGVVDLIVTDPPYGQEWQSNRREDRLAAIAGDGSTDVALAGLRAALSTLRRGRHVYAFGRYDWTGLPLCEPADLVWDKGILGPGDLTSVWGPSHEPIQFAVYEISKANREKGYGRLAARLRRGTVLRVQRKQSGQVARHPTEKPVALLRQLVEASSCADEVVLDPFMGVGSTLVAALLEGRRAVGIEVHQPYVDIAVGRVQAALTWLAHGEGL